MATDPDGDSQMASSPESTQSLSDSQPGSRTPTRHTQFAGASELSPPGSQAKPTAGMNVFGKDVEVSGFQGSNAESQSQSQSQSHSQSHSQSYSQSHSQSHSQTEQQPGASWMNKRAEEEYQRAMEYVIDQDFNLDEFGDPFDERDMQEKLF